VNHEKRNDAKKQVAATNQNQIHLGRRLASTDADENNADPKSEARNHTEHEKIATVENHGCEHQHDDLLDDGRGNRCSIRRRGSDWSAHGAFEWSNAKLTDDEERAKDIRAETCGWPRSSSFGPASR